MKDELGDRMKSNYESRFRFLLPRRAYTILRIDGKAFHTYTRKMEKPFDEKLINAMNATALYLCKNIGGAKMAYVQSDEISVLLTDFDNLNTQAWFDNNLQKLVSISSSMATVAFNKEMITMFLGDGSISFDGKWAEFDSRVFQIPQRTEVENYFIWRQNDTIRNSILNTAQAYFSHKQLANKNTTVLKELLLKEKNVDWENFSSTLKFGRIIRKQDGIWEVAERTPKFTEERYQFNSLIPYYEKLVLASCV